jgi:hypothetical protein
VTDFRMPAPTLDVVSVAPADPGCHLCDISTPIIDPVELITGLGGYPTVTFPIRRDRPVDVGALWEFISEPAEFFGLAVPPIDEFRDAVGRFAAAAAEGSSAALLAARLTLVGGRVVVSGTPGAAFESTAVRIGRLDPREAPVHADDAYWLRMAGRTVSSAATDDVLRALRERGSADGIPAGAAVAAPLSGALVIDTGEGTIGIGNDEPLSILDQLRDCGLLADLPRRTEVVGADVQRAWWISPRFATHPVALLGECALPVDPNQPPFLEQL